MRPVNVSRHDLIERDALENEPPSQLLHRMARLAGVKPDNAVCVVGPNSLSAMIGLCRMGFSRVECAQRFTAACADEVCDVLFVVGPCDAAGLSALLARTARLLKSGGLVVIEETDVDADCGLHRALAGADMDADWIIHDMADGCLAAAKCRRKSLAAAA